MFYAVQIAYLDCMVKSRMETGDHYVLYAIAEDGKLQVIGSLLRTSVGKCSKAALRLPCADDCRRICLEMLPLLF